MIQTSTSIKLHISTDPRHPQEQDAYDKQNHAYRQAYVQPESWQLHLAAELPETIEQCEWHIEQMEGEFRRKIVQKKGANRGQLSVAIPAPGEYEIRVTALTENGRSHTHHQTYHLRDYLMIAIGDSYFCGEGSPDEPGEPATLSGTVACNLATFTKFLVEKVDAEVPMAKAPVWQEKFVHRSYNAGVSLAARAIEDTDEGVAITFLNFARSGAAIDKGFFNPREQDEWTELGELEEARQTIGERPIDVLLLSTGGNDIEFSDRLIDLLRDDLPVVGDGGLLGDDALNRQKELNEALKMLEKLPAKLDKLAEGVATLQPQLVFLTEYPIAHFDIVNEDGEVTTRSGCGIFNGPDMAIDERDAALIKDVGKKLNETLREGAKRHGWIFVEGIADGFAGHGRCSDDKYFYSAEESCKIQGDFKGTMHPNEKGNQVYARCIEAALREHWLSTF